MLTSQDTTQGLNWLAILHTNQVRIGHLPCVNAPHPGIPPNPEWMPHRPRARETALYSYLSGALEKRHCSQKDTLETSRHFWRVPQEGEASRHWPADQEVLCSSPYPGLALQLLPTLSNLCEAWVMIMTSPWFKAPVFPVASSHPNLAPTFTTLSSISGLTGHRGVPPLPGLCFPTSTLHTCIISTKATKSASEM